MTTKCLARALVVKARRLSTPTLHVLPCYIINSCIEVVTLNELSWSREVQYNEVSLCCLFVCLFVCGWKALYRLESNRPMLDTVDCLTSNRLVRLPGKCASVRLHTVVKRITDQQWNPEILLWIFIVRGYLPRDIEIILFLVRRFSLLKLHRLSFQPQNWRTFMRCWAVIEPL